MVILSSGLPGTAKPYFESVGGSRAPWVKGRRRYFLTTPGDRKVGGETMILPELPLGT
jgi:hypothetical protein